MVVFSGPLLRYAHSLSPSIGECLMISMHIAGLSLFAEKHAASLHMEERELQVAYALRIATGSVCRMRLMISRPRQETPGAHSMLKSRPPQRAHCNLSAFISWMTDCRIITSDPGWKRGLKRANRDGHFLMMEEAQEWRTNVQLCAIAVLWHGQSSRRCNVQLCDLL